MFATTKRYLFSRGSTLFTWGKNTNALGYKVNAQTTSVAIPQLVKGFENIVQQVVMGFNHSALVTTNGELFTWGPGGSGVLGHNDDKQYDEPKLVEFFTKNKLKVSKVALGEYHTVALTDDGDVWTWGYGGKEQNMLMDLLFLQVGALGHGDLKTRYTPTPVKSLRHLPPVREVQCGQRFTSVLNEHNEMYVWGKGDYGVFGDGNNKSLKAPIKNEYFEEYLKKTQNLSIVKVRSCNNYSVALMSDGNLYGWGSNENGQMGIKTEIGVEIYETANFPTMVVNEEFAGNKIVDFAVAEDLVAILLDNNEVYWSGMKIAYKAERLPLPPGISKIKTIGCCHRCVVVVTEDGELYFKNKFVQDLSEDLQTGIRRNTTQNLFGSGTIKEIGGTYRNRFALVDQ